MRIARAHRLIDDKSFSRWRAQSCGVSSMRRFSFVVGGDARHLCRLRHRYLFSVSVLSLRACGQSCQSRKRWKGSGKCSPSVFMSSAIHDRRTLNTGTDLDTRIFRPTVGAPNNPSASTDHPQRLSTAFLAAASAVKFAAVAPVTNPTEHCFGKSSISSNHRCAISSKRATPGLGAS
jgi:hypothetical protein